MRELHDRSARSNDIPLMLLSFECARLLTKQSPHLEVGFRLGAQPKDSPPHVLLCIGTVSFFGNETVF